MYKGYVFNKLTGEALSGVRVSDGRNTVLTDDGGAFCLEGWERAAVISVNVLTTSHDDWYKPIKNAGGDFNFYITPAQTKAEHSFIHITDSEVGEKGCANWIDFLIGSIKKESADFVIHTGDICAPTGLYTHKEGMNFDTVGVPVRYTIGNHDFWDGEYGEALYEELYGPIAYSFDYGNIHYVALPIKLGQRRSGYNRADSDIWLKNDLATVSKDKKIIVFCHDICEIDEEDFVLGEELDLKQHGLLAWVFGHYHYSFLNEKNGVFNITTSRPDVGGIDSSPAALRKITISAKKQLESKLLYNNAALAYKGDEYAWRINLGADILFSNPIEVNGKILIGTSGDGFPKNCGVACIAAESGKLEWFYKTENAVKNNVIFYNGHIFAQDSYGILYKLTLSGELVWCVQTVTARPHYTLNGITAADGMIFCGSGKQLNAVDANSGTILWTSFRIERDWTAYLSDSAAKFIYHNKTVFYGTHWSRYFAVESKNGRIKWENKDVSHLNSTAAIYKDTIIVPSYDSLAKINIKTGETLLKVKVDPFTNFNTAGSPVVYENEIYFPTVNRGIAVIDPETLSLKRFFDCEKGIVSASPYCGNGYHAADAKPIVNGEELVFISSGGVVNFYNSKTGEKLREIRIGNPSYVTPLLLNGKIITADLFGNITAYSI